ncbi:class I tRNA ligase family protein, partial [Candidatus Saccharibacteria bacterium]|nr:class I tRNA ligase family protein [Candidatus Saccharibacteria bacterium]
MWCFIEDKLGPSAVLGSKPDPKTAADAWILSKLQRSKRELRKLLEAYRFGEAYELVYHLVWDDFADWYIEAAKIEPNPSLLSFGLETVLKLAHPFAPFVTETIWQTLSGAGNNSLLITSPWPEVPDAKASEAASFEEIKSIVEEIRFIQSSLKHRKFTLYHLGDDWLTTHGRLIKTLA